MLSKLTDNKYDENGETLISINTPRSITEQNTLRNVQNDENCGNFNASNQIYNTARIVDENGQIHQEEQLKNTDNKLTEHSLTKCRYCQTVFPYSLGRLHAQTCNESMANRTASVLQENLKKCPFCRSVFPDSLLEQHTQTCTRRKIHRCLECNKDFRILSKLRVHQQSHSEERLYSCNICAKLFKFKSGLSRHIKQQHSGGEANEFDTSLCGELQGLEYASLQNEDVQTFERESLTRTGLKTSRLEEYGSLQEDLNHQKSSGHYEMGVDKSGYDKYKENNFAKQHSDRCKADLRAAYSHKDESLLKGDDYFENVVDQNDHRQSKETNVGDENLRQDPNSFKNEGENLKQNDACDGNVKEVNFEVKEISRRNSNECFPNPVPSVTMQSCDENKVYRCQECPRTFEKPSRLEIHKRSHSDEKLFACEICQQAFKYKGSLSRHVREQHYGQGRKSFSITLDGKQRNEQESYLSGGKFGNDDMYLANVTESNDGVFRHWKERHYSQERTRFSMVCEGQRNKPEDCSSLVKINSENDDKSLISLDKCLRDEVTGHLKGQDVAPRSLSKGAVETEINEPQNCSSLEKNEFQNDDENLSKQYESLEHKESSSDGESSDEGDNNLSMVFGKRQDGKTFTLNDESWRENGKNNSNIQEHQRQGQENLRMIFSETQEDRKTLSSQDEENFENVDNTNEHNAKDVETFLYEENNFEENDSDLEENNLSMVFHHSQGNKKTLSSRDENSFQNVDNTRECGIARECESVKYEENNFEESNSDLEENNRSMVYHSQGDVGNSSQCHKKVTETCKFGESGFEFQETSKQEEGSFANRRRNLEEHSLEKGENIFGVNSRAYEAFNGCSTNAIVAVNTPNCGKDKIYQCEACQKVFVKRSAWANHKRTHNDEMSFACEICWKYFKYKGSLSRHIKEQHYGLGRKDQGHYNVSDSSPSRDNLIHKDAKRFAPIVNEVESTTPGNDNSSSSKEEYNLQIRVDEFGTILNQSYNTESHLNARTMISDKRLESDSTYSSIQNVNLGSAVNQVDSKDSNVAVEKFAGTNFTKEKTLDIKHTEQNNDETMLAAVNLYINKKDGLKENQNSSENSLQNTEQEDRTSDSRQGESDVLDDKLQTLPEEITCEICGRCFKHKGSLNRHVKEQHYGLGRKSFRTNVDENQGGVNCYVRSGENNFEIRIDCSRTMVNCEAGNYTDGALSMVPVANEGNGNGCSSLAKLNLQNRVIHLGKTMNDVLCKGDDSREETFELKQSYFETKSAEHSEKEGLNSMSSLEIIKERKLDSKQEYLNDKQSNDSTMMKKGSRAVQEEDSFNKNERSFDDVLQDIDHEEERQMDRNEESFDVRKGSLEKSPTELTCGICGRYFKHKGSLNRHAKEQHYGMGRKAVKTLFSNHQRSAKRCSLETKADLTNEFDGCKPNLNDDKQHNVIFHEGQGSGHSSSHVEAILNKVEDKDENFEQRDFELKETSGDEQNHAIRPRDDFKKNQDNFQLNLKETDRELSNLETNFDASDNNVENLSASKGNQSHGELDRRCREANVFMCDACPKIFPNRTAMKKHKRVHSNDMSFTCEICQQPFKYKGSMNRHVKEQHYGMGRKGIRKMFDESIGINNGCSSVGNVYNPRSTNCEDGHFEEQNFERENFEVNERQLATKQDGIYNNATTSKDVNFAVPEIDDFEHNLQHKQGTNFDNKQANSVHDDSFDLAKNKVKQERNVDTKQNEFDSSQAERLEKTRTHKCPDCPKTFCNLSELREHTYKHTDVKSFPCKLCEKAFKFRSGLVRHNRKEHKKPDLIRNETRVCCLEENDFGEESLQRKRSAFETKERSVFCGQIGSNERLKRNFSEGKDRGSDSRKDVDTNELIKRKFRRSKDSFETDIDNRSEMGKGCLHFEFDESALEDEDHGSDSGGDVDTNELRKRKFCEGDETMDEEETSFANEEMSVQSVRQDLPVKRKSFMYNCNKCDAVFQQLCDFLTHQSIHK